MSILIVFKTTTYKKAKSTYAVKMKVGLHTKPKRPQLGLGPGRVVSILKIKNVNNTYFLIIS